jgi:2-keto-4-pentenoate hydratase/2-oxohepta-3-ene-1,7-dioic acid hydratase in catechol pathway
MRIVGYITSSGERHIACRDGEHIVPLGPVNHFWKDPVRFMLAAASVTERLSLKDITLAHPVPDSARILCLGLNYRAHAAEGNFNLPDYPMIFGRWTASLVPDGTPVPVPVDESGLDWEGEIAAVVGEPICRADADDARSKIMGYAAFNDLSARRAQKLTAQWTLGKNSDNSGPMGDILTSDKVGDLRDGLRVQTIVNGVTRQDGNTKDMIFELGEVLALVSRTMTLNPGDVIVTGTPEGVGYALNPPVLLTPGDVVTVDIERIGSVTSPVISHDDLKAYPNRYF